MIQHIKNLKNCPTATEIKQTDTTFPLFLKCNGIIFDINIKDKLLDIFNEEVRLQATIFF